MDEQGRNGRGAATRRLTMSQALLHFLAAQRTERDGMEQPLIAGVFGILGHGNIAGFGQALQERPDLLRYIPTRNEQAQVHAAIGYARMRNRLQTFACTSSIGPGATNMVTGAATATINRLPVLLLPGDIFASRRVSPVLQQLEWPGSQDASVNDCLRPVSRYWDRINRPDQLLSAAVEAMRVLTSPAETGAVTLALPQDVQAEAFDYPEAFFRPRVWHVPRSRPDSPALRRAVELIRSAKRPLIVAGGGVIYSDATEALRKLAEASGIPVGETQAGKGSLPYDHPLALGAIGVTGTPGANILAREADLVIGIGTRYSDFTTASRTAFQDPEVRFVNVNVVELDAGKHGGIALVGDARETLTELHEGLRGWSTEPAYRERAAAFQKEWDAEVERIYSLGSVPRPSQGEVIGAVNRAAGPRDVLVCAAGSMPGDLHKLWRTRDPKGYHVEYGYSCMGYEVAAGMGVKLAAPDRDVYVLVGDGSWLMMSSEIVTAIQEGVKIIVVLVDNHGYASIGGLSRSLGLEGFGTEARGRGEDGLLSGPCLEVDLAANARSLGAAVIEADDLAGLTAALEEARNIDRAVVISLTIDAEPRVPGYESWWDVPVAEVADSPAVQEARRTYEEGRTRERWLLPLLLTGALLTGCAAARPAMSTGIPPGLLGDTLRPTVISERVLEDSDDPAIWIDPVRPENSLVLGTDKADTSGGVYVFGLDGRIDRTRTATPLQRMNNVDVEYGLMLDGRPTDVAVATERNRMMLRVFSLPEMRPVDGGGIAVFDGDSTRAPMGVSLYRRPRDGALFAFVGGKGGPVNGSYLWQFRLEDDGTGSVRARKVREFGAYSGLNEIEAIAVDDPLGFVYYSDEGAGIRKYHADPEAGNQELAFFGMAGFVDDQEGIGIYERDARTGYIVVSDQGGSRLQVFTREGSRSDPHAHALLAVIPVSARETDGLEVTSRPIGAAFSRGLLVMMSTDGTFHYYRWQDVQAAIDRATGR